MVHLSSNDDEIDAEYDQGIAGDQLDTPLDRAHPAANPLAQVGFDQTRQDSYPQHRKALAQCETDEGKYPVPSKIVGDHNRRENEQAGTATRTGRYDEQAEKKSHAKRPDQTHLNFKSSDRAFVLSSLFKAPV